MLKSLNNQFSYRVYYEDTDAGGVVYYANYLKFFERARTDFLRTRNINQSHLAKELGIIFVVKDCIIKYLKPAILDDLIIVSVIINEIKAASIKIKQVIYKKDENQETEIILAQLEVQIACVDSNNFRITKIPPEIFSQLQN